MKRPASEQPEIIPPPRSRRRLSSQPRAEVFNPERRPHDSLVADDEDSYPSTANPQEVQNIISLKYTSPTLHALESKVGEAFHHSSNKNSPVLLGDMESDVVSMRQPTRRLPRIKVIPPRDPSSLNIQGETDSTLSTPAMSPEGLPAPPCSPSREEMDDMEREATFPHLNRKWGDMETQDGPIVDISKLPPEPAKPVREDDLFWPEHRPPTPPFFAKHFEPRDVKLQADTESLGSAARNANTYVKKVKIVIQETKGKKKKGKKPWSFTDCEEYPRGETPPIELLLDKDDDDTSVPPLALTTQQEKLESDFSEDEEMEVMRDPGIAIGLSVDIDPNGRFVCKWGDCNKTFARNDHLGRHVKVSHLRVRKHRCEPCQMAFIGVKGLRNHEKTHVVPKTADTESMEETRDAMNEDDPALVTAEEESVAPSLLGVSSAPTIGGLDIEPEDEGDPFFD